MPFGAAQGVAALVDTRYECAIDFGGSATKIAIRQVGVAEWTNIPPVPNAHIWNDANAVAKKLVTGLVQAGAPNIEAVGFSISGDVSADQIITASDRLKEQNPEQYGNLFNSGGFDLKASIQGWLLPGAFVGVANDGAAAALGVAFHPNKSIDNGPVLVVTLGSNPAIAIVQRGQDNIELFPPSYTGFSRAQIGTSDGPKALHAPGGIRREDLEGMDVDRKSARIGRAVAAVLSDPDYGYLKKYGYLPTGGIYLMGGLSVLTAADGSPSLNNELVQQQLQANLSEPVKQRWRELKNDPNAPLPQALVFGTYADQCGVHLNGALMYARHSPKIHIHE
jgi:hypothetical protein